MTMPHDEIGYWSEIKLDIVREYASAYSKILTAQGNLYHLYVDAFAGSGVHVSRATKEFVLGSPLNALNVDPPFREFHFIDIEGSKLEALRGLVGERPNVHLYEGNCNQILLEQVFTRARFEDFRRALCLIDPYGLHLDWSVIQAAGQLGTVDMFLNFPTMDMNRNVLLRNPDAAALDETARLTRFWGDESWREAAYSRRNLFDLEMKAGDSNQAVVDAFRLRLKEVGGFGYVPEAIPMRNSLGFTIYYLIFASPKQVAGNIARDIFRKYQDRGLRS